MITTDERAKLVAELWETAQSDLRTSRHLAVGDAAIVGILSGIAGLLQIQNQLLLDVLDKLEAQAK